MTPEKAFDKIWTHFVINKANPGWDDVNEVCSYQNEKGDQCAIGCLLPDDLREEARLNALGIAALLENSDGIRKFFRGIPVYFLKYLQNAHDLVACDIDFHSGIETQLRAFAQKYSLRIPEQENSV